jgi:cytoskeleton protein RodZ
MTAHRQTGDFGAKLREARERKGVSLRQIANVTKISVGMLDALERNDIKRLPGGIFSRAFVRSFASEVGLDPETTIQEFIAQFGDDSVGAGNLASTQIEDNVALDSARRTASTFISLLVVSVVVAAVIIYFTIAGRRAAPVTTESAPAAAAQSAAALEPERSPVAAPSSSNAASDRASAPVTDPRPVEESAADRLVVNLVASRQCWVSATVDGKKQVERLLQPGDRRTFEVRRELVVTIGDAGAVTMTINGTEAKPLGKSGEVVTTRLDLSNFRTFLPTR